MTILVRLALVLSLAFVWSPAQAAPDQHRGGALRVGVGTAADGPLLAGNRLWDLDTGAWTDPWALNEQPLLVRFSPDGTRIAEVVRPPGSGFVTELRIRESATRQQSRLVDTGSVSDAEWSPDGTSLAYVIRDDLGGVVVKRVSAAGGEPVVLVAESDSLQLGDGVSWSPDGSRVLFAASDLTFDAGPVDPRSRHQLFTVEAVGASDPEPFNVAAPPVAAGATGTAYLYSWPHWRSDGRVTVLEDRREYAANGKVTEFESSIVTLDEGDADPELLRSFYVGYDPYAPDSPPTAVGLAQGPMVWSADDSQLLVSTLTVGQFQVVGATTGVATPLTVLSDGFAFKLYGVLAWQPCPGATCATWADAPQVDEREEGFDRPAVGRVLRIDDLSDYEGAQLSWEWLRDGQRIPDAVAAVYRLTRADAGHQVMGRMTKRSPSADPAVHESPTVKIPAYAATKPTIRGKGKVKAKLTGAVGQWSAPGYRLQLQWLRQGKPIRKATKATYRTTSADRGRRITLKVTATRVGWPSVTAASKPLRVR